MKKLQYNFTTLEQSKRLLALGVPFYSADCYYEYFGDQDGVHEDGVPIYGDFPQYGTSYVEFDMPCWSLGRLIEIMSNCGDDIGQRKLDITRVSKFYNDSVNVIELAVEDIEKLVADDGIDFSKLEE